MRERERESEGINFQNRTSVWLIMLVFHFSFSFVRFICFLYQIINDLLIFVNCLHCKLR